MMPGYTQSTQATGYKKKAKKKKLTATQKLAKRSKGSPKPMGVSVQEAREKKYGI